MTVPVDVAVYVPVIVVHPQGLDKGTIGETVTPFTVKYNCPKFCQLIEEASTWKVYVVPFVTFTPA